MGAPLRSAHAWNELINVQVVAVVGYDRQRLVLGLAAEEAAREDAATRTIGELFWACAGNDPRSRPTFQTATERLEAAYHAYQKATHHFENAANPALWYELACVYVQFGAFQGAAETLGRIIKAFPSWSYINSVIFLAACE